MMITDLNYLQPAPDSISGASGFNKEVKLRIKYAKVKQSATAYSAVYAGKVGGDVSVSATAVNYAEIDQ